ncbi:MAG TPA: hypothetical protein VN643_14055 [Pyrinomonadaceae bacterium]|nr:hypothetical protein [Pyrinomonadaceae bacterium]
MSRKDAKLAKLWFSRKNRVEVYTPQDADRHSARLKPYFRRQVVEAKVRSLFPNQDPAEILQLPGVVFVAGPEHVVPGQPLEAEAVLIYYPLPEHDAVVPGATFTIREGARVVGYGRAKRIFKPDAVEQVAAPERG